MIEKIKDIEIAVENGAYFSALALALTLPDVCGKIAFPEERTKKDWYSKWYDKYCGSSLPTGVSKNLPVFDGKFCYCLRCSYLHSGIVDNDVPINKFSFTKNGCDFNCSVTYINSKVEKTIVCEIKKLCKLICIGVEWFIQEFENKKAIEDITISISDFHEVL